MINKFSMTRIFFSFSFPKINNCGLLYIYINLDMKKLPLEIIIAITSYLSFKDKLNLACCSKNFYRIISEKTLYSQLVFLQEGRFRQALEFFKGRLTSGLQVHKLCIGNMTYDEQLVTTLPALFARV